MSEAKYPPKDKNGQPIAGDYSIEKCAYYALTENIAGQSALNMQPSPKPCTEEYAHSICYTTHTDKWVDHAMDHFCASAQWTMILVNSKIA